LPDFGVRFAIYFSGIVSGFIALLGQFHGEKTGMKEISLGLLVTVAIYAINLLKGYRSGALGASNALIAAMMLDILGLNLSMTFSMKECLCASKTTLFSLFLQFLSLIVIVFAVAGFSQERHAGDDKGCNCFRAHWWMSSIDTCTGPSTEFWLHYSVRVIFWTHDLWLCCQLVPTYYSAKKAAIAEPESRRIGVNILETVHDSIPATACSKYRDWFLAFVGSTICIEMTLRAHGLQGAQRWQSWGQMAQVITACWICFRWCNCLFAMFTEKSVRRRQQVLERTSIKPAVIPQLGSLSQGRPDENKWSMVARSLEKIRWNHPFGDLPSAGNSQ
jgi:hypothetical protein